MDWRAAARRCGACALTFAITVTLTFALALSPSARAEPAPDCPPTPTATAPTPESLQADLRNARDHGFLWRIEKGGRRSHLFGTVHVARREWMFPGPNVAQALREADTVALELDLLDPNLRQRLAAAMAPPAARPALPAALTQRLARLWQAECLDARMLTALGPEIQLATLAAMSARRDGLDPAYGIDIFLAGVGHGAGKNVVSLETPELQMQALQAPDTPDVLALMEHGLEQLEAGRARSSGLRIAQVWADTDDAALMHYDEWCECRETESDRAAMTRLLDDRNPALADAIDGLHTGGQRVFAAVGSLHMVGPLGLPALLAQRGYTVERVAFTR